MRRGLGIGLLVLLGLGCEGGTGATPAPQPDVIADVADVIADVAGTDAADTGGDSPDSVDGSADATATAWSTLTVQKGAGPCPPGGNCQWTWQVTPDGRVTATLQGQPDAWQLTAAQVQTLHQLVGPPAFLAGMTAGFTCPQPPTDVGVSLKFETTTGTFGQDVTGCVFGAQESLPAKVYQLVTVK